MVAKESLGEWISVKQCEVWLAPFWSSARLVVTEESRGGRHKGIETIMSGWELALVARRWPEACARHGRLAATPLPRQHAFHYTSNVHHGISSSRSSKPDRKKKRKGHIPRCEVFLQCGGGGVVGSECGAGHVCVCMMSVGGSGCDGKEGGRDGG